MKSIRIICGAFCALMAAAGVSHSLQQPSAANLLLTLLFAVFALLLLRPREKKASRPAAAPAPKPVHSTVTPRPSTKQLRIVYEGKVTGVSFDGRQDVLARLMEKADDGDLLEFSLEQDTYQGKPSIKVMGSIFGDDKDPKQIGFIAAVDVAKVLPYVGSAEVDCEIYGGPDYEGDDRYYGASIAVMVRE